MRGDRAKILLFGPRPNPEQIIQLREQLGLDKPLPVQYFSYLGRLLHGDLGTSFITGRPIAEEIAARFPHTLQLTLAAMLVAVGIGVPAGIVSGVLPRSWADRIAGGFSISGLDVPYIWSS